MGKDSFVLWAAGACEQKRSQGPVFFAEKRTSEWSRGGDVFSELQLAALGWVRTEKSET